MLNKAKYTRSIYSLLNLISLSAKKNKEFFFYKTTKNFDNILTFLLINGYILSYSKYNEYIYIKLKINSINRNFNSIFLNIEKSTKLKQKNKTFSVKDLTKLQKKEGSISKYLINTDKGLLTSYDSINKHLGGKILLKIC